MSADNWGFCPKCKKDFKESESNYGKVSEEEFLNSLNKKPVKLEETLREDYRINVDADGEFEVIYNCKCDCCGFTFYYSHKEQII